MITATTESDDNNERARGERPIIKILRERAEGADAPDTKDGKRYAYLWTLTSRRRENRTWRTN